MSKMPWQDDQQQPGGNRQSMSQTQSTAMLTQQRQKFSNAISSVEDAANGCVKLLVGVQKPRYLQEDFEYLDGLDHQFANLWIQARMLQKTMKTVPGYTPEQQRAELDALFKEIGGLYQKGQQHALYADVHQQIWEIVMEENAPQRTGHYANKYSGNQKANRKTGKSNQPTMPANQTKHFGFQNQKEEYQRQAAAKEMLYAKEQQRQADQKMQDQTEQRTGHYANNYSGNQKANRKTAKSNQPTMPANQTNNFGFQNQKEEYQRQAAAEELLNAKEQQRQANKKVQDLTEQLQLLDNQ